MTRIGIISDTHGTLRPEALSALEGVAHIIHAGDVGRGDIVLRLSAIAPVTAIRGNIDTGEWAGGLPETATLTLLGQRFFIIHDRNDLRFDPAAEGYDVVVSGHSHQPRTETIDGVLYLNPGSAGPRRFKLPVTLAILRLGDGALSPELRSIV